MYSDHVLRTENFFSDYHILGSIKRFLSHVIGGNVTRDPITSAREWTLSAFMTHQIFPLARDWWNRDT